MTHLRLNLKSYTHVQFIMKNMIEFIVIRNRNNEKESCRLKITSYTIT